jgi:hypothetical protein
MEAYKLGMVQFQTVLHIRIHPFVIWSKLQKVLEQDEMDDVPLIIALRLNWKIKTQSQISWFLIENYFFIDVR